MRGEARAVHVEGRVGDRDVHRAEESEDGGREEGSSVKLSIGLFTLRAYNGIQIGWHFSSVYFLVPSLTHFLLCSFA